MLSPKRTKFKKQHRGRMTSKSSRNTTISFGEYALQAQEPGWITSRQIEATRRTLTHALKREGKLWVKIFPDKPITARSAESRMGSGKGSVEFWVAVVKPNTLLFEVGEITKSKAQQAMKLAAYKLPVKTKFLTKF